MKKFVWTFLRNVFEIITQENFRKMDSLSLDHDLKLFKDMTNPIIAVIYNTFHPLRQDYHTLYTAYKTARALSQAATQVIEAMWALLSSQKLEDWDVAIRKVYRKDTSRYKELFPNGHKPFRTGRYEERITYIESLSEAIGSDAALTDVKLDVDTFISDYYSALADQKGKQRAIKECSDQLKVSRAACATGMYTNLGYLIWNYGATPEVIGGYFDLEQIRRSSPGSEGGSEEEFSLSIPAGGAVEGGFAFTDETVFLLYNAGMAKLAVNTSATPAQAELPANAVILEPEDENEIAADHLGMAGNRYLIITNLDPADEGEISISIVK